jgi:DNA-binding Xre family transcriptional regulator
MTMKENRYIGSSFDQFLEEEGIRAEVEEVAVKRVLAWQIQKAMHEQKLTKAAMARAMKTSRAALDRLLDPENSSVTLRTLERAAAVVGKEVHIELQDASPDRESVSYPSN